MYLGEGKRFKIPPYSDPVLGSALRFLLDGNQIDLLIVTMNGIYLLRITFSLGG